MILRLERATRVDALVACVGLALASNAILPLLTRGPDGVTSNDSFSGPLWFVLLAYTVTVFARKRSLTALIEGQRPVLIILLLAALSTAWSDSPRESLSKLVLLAIAISFAAFLVDRFDLHELATVIAWVLLGLVVMSLVCVIALPAYGLDHFRADAWRGVFTTKNELGRIAAVSAVLWFVYFVTVPARRIRAAVALALSLTAAIGSDSRTALVVLLAMTPFLIVMPALRAHFTISVPAWCGLFATALIGFSWIQKNSGAALSSFGSDSTLTGRDEIWAAVFAQIQNHNLLGYGFGAFWRGYDGPSANVWALVPSAPPHAHNAFLDVWLDLGVVGLLVFGIVLVAAFVHGIRAFRKEAGFGGAAALALPAVLTLFSLTESTLSPTRSVFWITLIAMAGAAARATRLDIERQLDTSARRATLGGSPA